MCRKESTGRSKVGGGSWEEEAGRKKDNVNGTLIASRVGIRAKSGESVSSGRIHRGNDYCLHSRCNHS